MSPPGKEQRPGTATEALSDNTHTSAPSIGQAGDNVPSHRPWARRDDAHDVEVRYRRSVRYWLRRPQCVHGRRADECAS